MLGESTGGVLAAPNAQSGHDLAGLRTICPDSTAGNFGHEGDGTCARADFDDSLTSNGIHEWTIQSHLTPTKTNPGRSLYRVDLDCLPRSASSYPNKDARIHPSTFYRKKDAKVSFNPLQIDQTTPHRTTTTMEV